MADGPRGADHERHRRGGPTALTRVARPRRFPHDAAEIAVWQDRFMENVGAVIDGTVDVLADLRGRVRLFALSNWPAETADALRSSFEFFDWFDGIVISGEERMAKPDRALFERLCDRYALDPRTSVFVDDVAANTAAAAALGFSSVLFRSPDQLRRELSLLLGGDRG